MNFKWKRRRRQWWSAFWRGVVMPYATVEGLWASLVTITALSLLTIFRPGLVKDELTLKAVGALATFLLIPLWIVFNALIIAPFRVYRMEKSQGTWTADKYSFHVPQHVRTFQWKAINSGNSVSLTFHDAEPNSFVYVFIEIDPAPTRTYVRLGSIDLFQIIQNAQKPYGNHSIGIRLDDKRSVSLYVEMLPQTVDVSIRIFLKSVEK